MFASAAFQVADFTHRSLPPAATRALADCLARAMFAVRPPARRALEANLARLMPDATRGARRALARRTFRNFARDFVDVLRMRRLSIDELCGAVEVLGGHHLDAARGSRRGVIVLSAHVGCWEWGAAWLASQGVRLHLAARAHREPAVARLFDVRRAAFGVRALPSGGLYASAAGVLRAGGWVAVMGDRSATPGRGSVCAWAAALARRTNALVLPVLMARAENGRHVLGCMPAMSAEACRDGGWRGAARAWLEQWPGQWAAFEPLAEGFA